MRRRDFLGAAALTGALASYAIEAKASPRHRPPNVIYVFSDQHRALSRPGVAYNQALAPRASAARTARWRAASRTTPSARPAAGS